MTSRRKTPTTRPQNAELVELACTTSHEIPPTAPLRTARLNAELVEQLGLLEALIAEAEGRKAGLQRSLETRQRDADADADAIRAAATRLLAAKLAARYIVGTIARTLKHSPAKVRRALRTHEAGHWRPGPRTKRSPGTR